MKKIYKYEMLTKTELPKFSELLDIQIQNGKLMGWFIVDVESEKEKRVFLNVLTGNELVNPENKRHLKTIQDNESEYHIFEEIKN